MAAEFNPDYGMDANGMSTASEANTAQWTTDHYKTWATLQKAFFLGKAQAPAPVPAPAPAAAVVATRSSGELAFDAIESLKMGFGSMLSAPSSTAGSRPAMLAGALWLSNVAKSLSPKPTEVDIVEFLVNPLKCNICAFTPLVSATEITEALAMAAQAKITDSNSSATVQGYVHAIKQLVKTSNNIDDMSSLTNVWFWISGLGSLNLELAQLLARWSLVAAIEAKKEPPAPEIESGSKLAQHVAQLDGLGAALRLRYGHKHGEGNKRLGVDDMDNQHHADDRLTGFSRHQFITTVGQPRRYRATTDIPRAFEDVLTAFSNFPSS
jgi:hypothetical protein